MQASKLIESPYNPNEKALISDKYRQAYFDFKQRAAISSYSSIESMAC